MERVKTLENEMMALSRLNTRLPTNKRATYQIFPRRYF